MHDLVRNEDRLRGTYEFPFEFHHIDSSHPRYVMSYHWHVECEIMRVLQGTLTVTLDEKSFTGSNDYQKPIRKRGKIVQTQPAHILAFSARKNQKESSLLSGYQAAFQ